MRDVICGQCSATMKRIGCRSLNPTQTISAFKCPKCGSRIAIHREIIDCEVPLDEYRKLEASYHRERRAK